jgi:transposase
VARAAATIELSEDEERVLRAVLRAPSAPVQEAMRAQIVLRAAAGESNTQIAAQVGVSLPTVGLWRRNFSERGLDGLATAPRAGRPREIDDAQVARVLAMTLETPPDGSSHWSARRLAAVAGISASTVSRIWREHKLKPHQVRSFKFSRDPQLVEKAWAQPVLATVCSDLNSNDVGDAAVVAQVSPRASRSGDSRVRVGRVGVMPRWSGTRPALRRASSSRVSCEAGC